MRHLILKVCTGIPCIHSSFLCKLTTHSSTSFLPRVVSWQSFQIGVDYLDRSSTRLKKLKLCYLKATLRAVCTRLEQEAHFPRKERCVSDCLNDSLASSLDGLKCTMTASVTQAPERALLSVDKLHWKQGDIKHSLIFDRRALLPEYYCYQEGHNCQHHTSRSLDSGFKSVTETRNESSAVSLL